MLTKSQICKPIKLPLVVTPEEGDTTTVVINKKKKKKNMKKVYNVPVRTSTSIKRNNSVEGETIEQQIIRLLNNGAPVDGEKIPIYTKPSEGVKYGTDIRGDKWDRAIDVNERINTDIDNIRKLKVVKKEEEENGKNEGKSEQNEGGKSEEK